MRFTSKSTLIGAAAALVVSTVLVAGFATSVTSGAGTDTVPVSTATPTVAAPAPTAVPANPPASAIEVPSAPATGPGGSELGVNNAPTGGTNGLPSAGYGPTASDSNGGMVVLLALLGIVGAGLAGVGAAAAKRRG